MILSCQNIAKAFGTEEIIRNASFHLEEHEKAAIVGINGAGKTTLLKIIVGELAPDNGSVTISRGKSLGYLEQHQDVSGDSTIYSVLLEEKRPLLDMEQRLRSMEEEMKHLSGDALQNLMISYNRISTEFERQNGYSVQSEVVGVLKASDSRKRILTGRYIRSPADRKRGLPSEGSCSRPRIFFCLMSRSIILILLPLHGWKIIS